MTSEQRMILDLTDVLAFRLECTKCGAAVVIKPADFREVTFECPGCRGMWEVPRTRDQTDSPMNKIGSGLRQLLEQVKSAATSGGTLPYRVRIELRDSTSSLYGLSTNT